MKMFSIPIVIIFCSIGLLVLALRLSGGIRTFSIPTTSNEPNIRKGDRIWVSNLVKPKRFDFICFHQEASDTWDGGIWLMRVCGMPGDRVEIINGTLYINKTNADVKLNLKEEYVISVREMNKLGKDYYRLHFTEMQHVSQDSVDIFLESAEYDKNSLSGRKVVRKEVDLEIKKMYNKDWNADNFGPLTVPENCFFVMGDNRHAAPDSRYTGFIKSGNYIGTVVK